MIAFFIWFALLVGGFFVAITVTNVILRKEVSDQASGVMLLGIFLLMAGGAGVLAGGLS